MSLDRTATPAFAVIKMVVGTVAALLLAAGCMSEKPAEQTPPTETIEAPIDVQMQPYYDPSSWTFEKRGTSIAVKTDIYMDDEGRGFAQNARKLTLYSVDDVEHVSVEGQNGVEFCDR